MEADPDYEKIREQGQLSNLGQFYTRGYLLQND